MTQCLLNKQKSQCLLAVELFNMSVLFLAVFCTVLSVYDLLTVSLKFYVTSYLFDIAIMLVD